ncbi:hypothetical protein BP5796_00958 [Coleophoma crateriformis]|uniref:chitinase n=1 Tax=Coleophoma crateriformis TaxID=565419 RepID=A0A3D8T9I3_9HELO|nr:hypothetical protein BP5796_00958 [Coleophoma crateriformis]
MHFSTLSLVAGLSTLLAPVLAQTWSSCNPMNTTCPANPALGESYNFNFSSAQFLKESWNITAGSLSYGDQGTEFTVAKQGDSPTVQSNFYIFFGSVSVVMKAATGQGIVSSIVLESDDLDEVDWEFMGGNNTSAETNYFGKGNTTSYDRAIYYGVDNPTGSFHNYTVDWTSDRIEWLIDGTLVRTLAYADALGGENFPQTPMNIRIGIWAGGDPSNSQGTIEWAGGATDYAGCPYTMYVSHVNIQDYSTGSAYNWGDKTGSWKSIDIIAGTSVAAANIANPNAVSSSDSSSSSSSSSSSGIGSSVDSGSSSGTSSSGNSTSSNSSSTNPVVSAADKWKALPTSTKTAVYAGSGAAAAILISAAIFFCARQRRAGRRERDAYNAKIEKEREDAYRDQMELREQGLGGWDSQRALGEDSLGGWAGNAANMEKSGHVPPVPKLPGNVSVNEVPSRSGTPGTGMGIDRGMARSPAATIVSPIPQSPARGNWNGGNDGGFNSNVDTAYHGGYGGNRSPASPGDFDFGGQQPVWAQQPQQTWPQQQPQQQPERSFPRSHQGYQQF